MGLDSMQRMLVIGSSGFIGSFFAYAARGRFEIQGACRRPDAARRESAIDLTDAASVRAAFAAARPEIVLHTAAMANIDECERLPELADAVNHAGARLVAEACRDAGARLVFTSTNAVFAGDAPPYDEEATPSPVNVYGATKARAEQAVLEALPSAAVVRLALVLGRSVRAGSNSMIDRFESWLARGEPVRMPTFEHRNPIDAATLADLLCELAARPDARGIFHVGAVDKMSRYALAQRLAERLGYPRERITAIDAPDVDRAPRGRDDFLSCARLAQYCQTPLPTCEQVVDICLAPASD